MNINNHRRTSGVTCDWRVNRGRPQIQLFLLMFRVASWRSRQKKHIRVMTLPFLILFRLVSLILGFDLPARVEVGPRLQIHHGVGLVVHPCVQIGSDVILRHGVTLGNLGDGRTDVPVIGNCVEFGANSSVIGGVWIGDGCKIGINAVATVDLAPRSVLRASPSTIK